MRLLSNLHVKGKPAVLPDRAIRSQSHYFIYRPCNVPTVINFPLLALPEDGGRSCLSVFV